MFFLLYFTPIYFTFICYFYIWLSGADSELINLLVISGCTFYRSGQLYDYPIKHAFIWIIISRVSQWNVANINLQIRTKAKILDFICQMLILAAVDIICRCFRCQGPFSVWLVNTQQPISSFRLLSKFLQSSRIICVSKFYALLTFGTFTH